MSCSLNLCNVVLFTQGRAQSAHEPSPTQANIHGHHWMASVSVSISPMAANLLAGQSQQFMSTVSGTSNTAVNWLVDGNLGGNSGVRTITATGLYSAPASTPSAAVTVTAQSGANPNNSASASISISQPRVNLTWNPSTSSVAGDF
jgi:hypothetical protein